MRDSFIGSEQGVVHLYVLSSAVRGIVVCKRILIGLLILSPLWKGSFLQERHPGIIEVIIMMCVIGTILSAGRGLFCPGRSKHRSGRMRARADGLGAEFDRREDREGDEKRHSNKLSEQEWRLGLSGSHRFQGRHFLEGLHDSDEDI